MTLSRLGPSRRDSITHLANRSRDQKLMLGAQVREGKPVERRGGITRAGLVIALTLAGCGEEAITAATGLVEAAEATDNPHALSFALLAHGFPFRDADPDRAREALRRGLVIAR
jgi:hypothetical protein